MPVTAKLSKHFYDVLGEDVANELVDWFNAVDLTYRTELRELNELNYARFDAKLEQRLAELRAELRQEIADLRAALREEMSELRAELRREITEFKAELRQDMAEFKAEVRAAIGALEQALQAEASARRESDAAIRDDLDRKLAELRASLLRWMFGFWVTSTLTLAGLILAVLARVK